MKFAIFPKTGYNNIMGRVSNSNAIILQTECGYGFSISFFKSEKSDKNGFEMENSCLDIKIISAEQES